MMGMRLLLFFVFVLVVVLLVGLRLALLTGQDRRRLSRAVALLRNGMLPSKVEERLVAGGLDGVTASEVVATALKALAQSRMGITNPTRSSAAACGADSEGLKIRAPQFEEPDVTATPHDRGIRLLYKIRDYEGALKAFTQAIEEDPFYPNAYLGRAVAHRRLGNFAAAQADERKAEELGGAERTAWDRLVNRAQERWHGNLANPEWKQIDPVSRKAVLFRSLMRQIHHGGLFQWVANGYDQWIDDLIEAAREVGTPASREVASLLEDLSRDIASTTPASSAPASEDSAEIENVRARQRDALLETIVAQENRYYRVEGQFHTDLESWFDEKAGRA